MFAQFEVYYVMLFNTSFEWHKLKGLFKKSLDLFSFVWNKLTGFKKKNKKWKKQRNIKVIKRNLKVIKEILKKPKRAKEI